MRTITPYEVGVTLLFFALFSVLQWQHFKHGAEIRKLEDVQARTSTACWKLREDIDELKKKLNDLEAVTEAAAESERRFQEGLNGILDYNLSVAMGGKGE